MNYKRIIERKREIDLLYEQTKEDKYLWEDDCINHFFECEGYKTYETIADFCIYNNIKRVFDIGCAYGHQSEIFLKKQIGYIGINNMKLDFWNKDKYQYIIDSYPCKIETHSSDLAISVLCLTWNCYLYEGEKTLKEQCEALSKDFRQCLLYLQPDRLEFVSKYFRNFRSTSYKGLIYFYN